eukprot:369581_1
MTALILVANTLVICFVCCVMFLCYKHFDNKKKQKEEEDEMVHIQLQTDPPPTQAIQRVIETQEHQSMPIRPQYPVPLPPPRTDAPELACINDGEEWWYAWNNDGGSASDNEKDDDLYLIDGANGGTHGTTTVDRLLIMRKMMTCI